MKRDIRIDQFVRDFLAVHRVEVWSRSMFPGWNSIWIIDGHVMSVREVRKLLIPMVMTFMGPDPGALKKIIWKLLAMNAKISDKIIRSHSVIESNSY
jgi:hypothetical protein